MLKVPTLKGSFICGPCNNPKAGYTAHEHLISYRLPRRDCITINGLVAFCDSCGKYAKISAIEDYNAELAKEAYAHPELTAAYSDTIEAESSAESFFSSSVGFPFKRIFE